MDSLVSSSLVVLEPFFAKREKRFALLFFFVFFFFARRSEPSQAQRAKPSRSKDSFASSAPYSSLVVLEIFFAKRAKHFAFFLFTFIFYLFIYSLSHGMGRDT